MPDFINMVPFHAALREPLRSAFRGERPLPWPDAIESGDVDAFLDAIDEHGIAPLLYARLTERGAAWPIAPALRQRAMRAAAIETSRLLDLRVVLDALHQRNIKILITKGTALAYGLYPSPELRARADTDLLVDVADREALRDVMQSLGYDAETTSGDQLAVRQQTFTRSDRFGVPHAYDVHWDVTNKPLFAGILRLEEMLPRAMPLPEIGSSALGLSRVDALLLACIHRVAHHHDSDRLIWLYDIHLLREAMTSEEHARFWRRAAEHRIVTICDRACELAASWFGGEETNRAADHLGADALGGEEPSATFLERARTYGGVMLDDFAALPSWRARFWRMWQLAVPPPRYLKRSFDSTNPFLLPWFYAYRSVRGVARLFRKVGR